MCKSLICFNVCKGEDNLRLLYVSLSPAPSDRGSTIIFIQFNHPIFIIKAAKSLLCEKYQAEVLTNCNANAVLFLTSVGF